VSIATAQVDNGLLTIDFKTVIDAPAIAAIEIIGLTPVIDGFNININSGGPAYVDTTGKQWLADFGYSAGSDSAVTGHPVSGTTDPSLFQSLRWDASTSSPDLTYDLLVPNGEYEVEIYLAELWSGAFSNGVRVFDIYLQGLLTFNDVDIFAEVGGNAALIKTAQITVTDNRLNLRFGYNVGTPFLGAFSIKRTSVINPNLTNSYKYGYDKNGNRKTLQIGTETRNYTYTTNSNRMDQNNSIQITLDANGNTTNDGTNTYSYNSLNRLIDVNGQTTYSYNGLGQRVSKVVDGVQTNFAYGLNGELLGEYGPTAETTTEYVYLNGTSFALVRQNQVYYIHTDHLGTPRVVSDSNQTVIWRWDSDAFGSTTANDDPDADGVKFELNLRFAGQYFDSETGLHYNYFRYYDPGTGRYITSDPIGLNGGLNMFGYVWICWGEPN
jgi:RHS repeat-associated protein